MKANIEIEQKPMSPSLTFEDIQKEEGIYLPLTGCRDTRLMTVQGTGSDCRAIVLYLCESSARIELANSSVWENDTFVKTDETFAAQVKQKNT